MTNQEALNRVDAIVAARSLDLQAVQIARGLLADGFQSQQDEIEAGIAAGLAAATDPLNSEIASLTSSNAALTAEVLSISKETGTVSHLVDAGNMTEKIDMETEPSSVAFAAAGPAGETATGIDSVTLLDESGDGFTATVTEKSDTGFRLSWVKVGNGTDVVLKYATILTIVLFVFSAVSVVGVRAAHKSVFAKCSDFKTQTQAQQAFDTGVPQYAHLDSDNDGRACESLK